MTEKRKKRRKLSNEILITFAICFVLTAMLFIFLTFFGIAVVEEYCFSNSIELDEEQYFHVDNVVVSAGLIISLVFFIVLFLALFGERLSYIKTIISGVDALRRGDLGHTLPINGNNELTTLAEEINYLSLTELEIKEKEQRLNEEKEELIRSLSHDIRTPLTSIMSYSEIFESKKEVSDEEQREYYALVRKKAEQIKNLTDILLDGGHRRLEMIADAKFLIEQLVFEFEELLEDDFELLINISECPEFSGNFDIGELRRIFDNLVSNIQKYADKEKRVELFIKKDDSGITIRQKNAIFESKDPHESLGIGLNSIKRIAQNYNGRVNIDQNDDYFEINILLSKF